MDYGWMRWPTRSPVPGRQHLTTLTTAEERLAHAAAECVWHAWLKRKRARPTDMEQERSPAVSKSSKSWRPAQAEWMRRKATDREKILPVVRSIAINETWVQSNASCTRNPEEGHGDLCLLLAVRVFVRYALPLSIKTCNSRFSRSQIVSTLTKFI
jgi:hypothetical protein